MKSLIEEHQFVLRLLETALQQLTVSITLIEALSSQRDEPYIIELSQELLSWHRDFHKKLFNKYREVCDRYGVKVRLITG